MKKYRISKNLLLVEKSYLGKAPKGKIIEGTVNNKGRSITIEIKQNLDDKTKFFAVCHEMVHCFDNILREPRNDEKTENICEELGKLIIGLWKNYDPFRHALIDSTIRKKT